MKNGGILELVDCYSNVSVREDPLGRRRPTCGEGPHSGAPTTAQKGCRRTFRPLEKKTSYAQSQRIWPIMMPRGSRNRTRALYSRQLCIDGSDQECYRGIIAGTCGRIESGACTTPRGEEYIEGMIER